MEIVLAIMFIPILLSVGAFLVYLVNYQADLKVRRYNQLHRFNPDGLGNYPAWYNPQTGEFFHLEPGNRAFDDKILILPGGIQRKIDARPPRPQEIQIRAYSQKVVDGEVQDEPPEPAELSTFEANELPERSNGERSEAEIRALLQAAHREGRPKQASIEATAGCVKGSSKAWRYWSAVWDQFAL